MNVGNSSIPMGSASYRVSPLVSTPLPPREMFSKYANNVILGGATGVELERTLLPFLLCQKTLGVNWQHIRERKIYLLDYQSKKLVCFSEYGCQTYSGNWVEAKKTFHKHNQQRPEALYLTYTAEQGFLGSQGRFSDEKAGYKSLLFECSRKWGEYEDETGGILKLQENLWDCYQCLNSGSNGGLGNVVEAILGTADQTQIYDRLPGLSTTEDHQTFFSEEYALMFTVPTVAGAWRTMPQQFIDQYVKQVILGEKKDRRLAHTLLPILLAFNSKLWLGEEEELILFDKKAQKKLIFSASGGFDCVEPISDDFYFSCKDHQLCLVCTAEGDFQNLKTNETGDLLTLFLHKQHPEYDSEHSLAARESLFSYYQKVNYFEDDYVDKFGVCDLGGLARNVLWRDERDICSCLVGFFEKLMAEGCRVETPPKISPSIMV